jgi:DNA-binding HxlR family transcriptional regulator
MRRKSFGTMNCSVAQTLEVVGEWWSMLIVRDAFLGVTRFDDFQTRLGISRNILTNRLEHLVERGVLERQPYQDRPVRYDYLLTEKGRGLWHVLAAMRQWGDEWECPHGPPVVVEHLSCGELTVVVPTCKHCGEALDAASMKAHAGPGAGPGQLPVLAGSA